MIADMRNMTGADLRAWRESERLFQREAAWMIGIAERTWREYEAATDKPVPVYVARSCRDISLNRKMAELRTTLDAARAEIEQAMAVPEHLLKRG